MTTAYHPTLVYRTSSRCSNGGCVEVAPLPDGGAVVRGTKDRAREPLTFDRQEWIDFVSAVKNGEFDFENYSASWSVDPQMAAGGEGGCAKMVDSAG